MRCLPFEHVLDEPYLSLSSASTAPSETVAMSASLPAATGAPQTGRRGGWPWLWR
jgi:hypothetical protein